MLLAAYEHAKEIYNVVHYSYARPTPLFFGNRRISSESGCQQGDPAAPLLFSLVLQAVLIRLQSQLAVSYLDDLTLADSDPNVLLADLQALRESVVSTGLQMNFNKCELYHQGLTPEQERAFSANLSRSLDGALECRASKPGITWCCYLPASCR